MALPGTSPDSFPGRATRIPFVHGCRLTTAARVRGGLVCNVSPQGAYVTLGEPFPEVGETAQLAVGRPGQEPLLEAEVVVACSIRDEPLGFDSLPPGVGLRFVSLAGPYRARIEGLLRQYHEGRGLTALASPPHAGPRRVPYVQRCRLTTARDVLDTVTCNLSRLGAYVAADPPPAVGEDVELAFAAPDGAPLAMRGVVSWQSADEADGLPAGCGVRFTELSKRDEIRVRALIDGFSPLRRA